MHDRRQSGSLEAEVMTVLWSADGPLTPSDVQHGLGRELAYTTVMTTLSRLHAKGVVERAKSGRAFAYSPVQRAEDQAAQTMTDVLAGGPDPAAVLSRFVNRLGPEEEAVLRRLLDRSATGDPRETSSTADEAASG
jgi:predicted transcriptional regulator